MATEMGKPRYTAELRLESSGLAPTVRSLSYVHGWSRLYQAGPYLIDLMLEPRRGGARLVGQVLPPEGIVDDDAGVRLRGGGIERRTILEDGGGFIVDLPAGDAFDLAIDLATAELYVPEIGVG